MQLSPEQVTILFNLYLKEHVLPGSPEHLPIFKDIKGGNVLMKRLYLVLRTKGYEHLLQGNKVDANELLRIGKELMKKHKKVFLVGLNHWATEKDIEVLEELYRKNFI